MDELNTPYDYAKLFASYTNQHIFLTGKAGTGKTTFLHRLRESSPKQMAVVAPTGVAAINAGGTTIHSFFQLPFSPFTPTEWGRKELVGKMKMQANRRNVLRELELLVIDEISMVRADVLDAIDTVLRHVRHRHAEPFGGVQMIFIGDMYQLSPVAKSDEWQLLSEFYEGIYFFNSRVFNERPFVHIEFNKVFRQQDPTFIQLLNEVRDNKLSAESRQLLDSRYDPAFVPPPDDTYIVLTTHNYKADAINNEELNKIKSPSKFFNAAVEGDFPEKSYPAEENLELKVGAKVMFVKNDHETPRRFFNGKIGKVTDWDDKTIWVECPGETDSIAVNPMEWENIRYKVDKSTLEVDEEVLGVFKQFPLRLAWAITIHKSQGLTFDKAVIDAEAAFASGQVYVALSRCRSLEGMVLQSRFSPFSIQNDDDIVRFSSQHYSSQQLENSYTTASNQYVYNLLLQIFDFSPMLSRSARWLIDTNDAAQSLGEDTVDFVRNVNGQVAALQDVGAKFSVQIGHLLQQEPFNEEMLNSRLKASADYFSERLGALIDTLKESPAVTDSRENAAVYDEHLLEIYTDAAKKRHWIAGIQHGFNVTLYFELRRTFDLPSLGISSYARKQRKEKQQSKNPELMYQLFELRNQITDETGLPIYLVAGSKSIVEMADYLPQTKSDLLRIYGFGEVKYQKYGERFLECIRDYCQENQLESSMNELFESSSKKSKKAPKEPKEKRKKGGSALVSLQAFQEGASIESIASARKLTVATISQHLNSFVEKGELEIDRFISRDKLQQAQTLVENSSEQGSLYSLLKEYFPPHELTFIISWLRRNGLTAL